MSLLPGILRDMADKLDREEVAGCIILGYGNLNIVAGIDEQEGQTDLTVLSQMAVLTLYSLGGAEQKLGMN